MILKKPYAFLIKYFKVIHVALLLMMSYLLYRTNIILNFLQKYITTEQLVTGKDFTGQLFSIWNFALPFIVIVILAILLGVMYYKKKPLLFYVINIAVMVGLLIIYNIGYDTAITLETKLIETRSLRLLRDFYLIVILIQGVSLIFTFIRATGFDIKKFDFRTDLEELNITEADNEEFEVDLDIETNILRRNFNRNLRFAKYIYKENKFIIQTVFLLAFAATCFIIYMNMTIYNKVYSENHLFRASDVTMEITRSYLTNQSYKNKKISDSYLMILELNVRANTKEKTVLNTTKAQLIVDNQIYYPKTKYRQELFDIGNVYQNTNLDTEFETILLVYEIPTSKINSSFIFRYIDNLVLEKRGINPKYIKIELKPYNLDKHQKEEDIELNSSVVLNETVFGNTSLVINKFELQDEFVIDYDFCVNKDECYKSKQYVRPNANTNYDKTILKITGSLDKDKVSSDIYSLYSIVNYFGQIEYKIGEKTKKQNVGFTELKPSKNTTKNIYYIEVTKEIKSAEAIDLVIKIRNRTYRYKIK